MHLEDKTQVYLGGWYLILNQVILKLCLIFVMGGLQLRVILGCRVLYWNRLGRIKGDCWALLDVCFPEFSVISDSFL